MQFLIDLMNMVAGKLEEATQSDVVVGEPIALAGLTIVPLSRLSVGLGGGGGEGEGEVPVKRSKGAGKGEGRGGGAGMGARVRPVGVAIFSDDGVEVLPIADNKGILDKIFDKVPELIDKVRGQAESGAGLT